VSTKVSGGLYSTGGTLLHTCYLRCIYNKKRL
jgi:hypothetical protein